MMRMILLCAAILLFTSFKGSDDIENATPFDYIDAYRELAIVEMHRAQIPASITMAQAILESRFGTSKLASNSNNHFGIKCKSYWTGKKYFHKDDDLDDQGNLMKSCFRKYDTVIDSYVDHSYFLKNTKYYKSLFDLSVTDYYGWAHGLKKCGYATAPKYGHKLVEIIERYHLYELDSFK